MELHFRLNQGLEPTVGHFMDELRMHVKSPIRTVFEAIMDEEGRFTQSITQDGQEAVLESFMHALCRWDQIEDAFKEAAQNYRGKKTKKECCIEYKRLVENMGEKKLAAEAEKWLKEIEQREAVSELVAKLPVDSLLNTKKMLESIVQGQA